MSAEEAQQALSGEGVASQQTTIFEHPAPEDVMPNGSGNGTTATTAADPDETGTLDIVAEVAKEELRPAEVVRRLDEYIIGQGAAKKSVAIALRNRIRRQKLEPEMAEEVMPKNILMMGPTGVGKTEIARRL
ncbi:MAG TPA: hypothetical protein VII79_03310, partial [Candidatus Dormibacteraeota bacterium]